MTPIKKTYSLIVFATQTEMDQLQPLSENRPPSLFQVAGKTLLEWNYEIGKSLGVKKVILLVEKNNKQLFREALEQYQEVSAPPNEIGPFTLVDYDSKIGLTKEQVRVILSIITKESIWLDGNVVTSPAFFKLFLEKAEGHGKYALVQNDGENKKCLGIGLFNEKFLETGSIGAKSVNDIFKIISEKVRSATQYLTFDKESMAFWQIKYLWNLLDANQVLINYIDEINNGIIEHGATIIGKVAIGKGSRIRAGTYLEGPVVIGSDCDIGPNCYLRSGVSLGDKVRIGNACEIKNTIINQRTHIAHLSYVGDSIIGEQCNFGAGTITGNLRLDDQTIKAQINEEIVSTGRRKLGVIVGDNVKTAINTYFMPGVIIGNDSAIGTGVIVQRNIGSGKFIYLEQKTTTTDWKVKSKKKD
ncbi:MAG: hypothetical protein JXA54_04150 [Candidatus Heimdallarchaeota archaeon]|nr:hypothetical protein [Candidatus Heimdallarchaeota archaeon]